MSALDKREPSTYNTLTKDLAKLEDDYFKTRNNQFLWGSEIRNNYNGERRSAGWDNIIERRICQTYVIISPNTDHISRIHPL